MLDRIFKLFINFNTVTGRPHSGALPQPQPDIPASSHESPGKKDRQIRRKKEGKGNARKDVTF
jgi:hypothetical protein